MTTGSYTSYWQPGPTPPRKMDTGTLFLFKPHALRMKREQNLDNK